MSLGINPGMGLSGMRERMRELGGALDVHSNGGGTTITATLPIADAIVNSDVNGRRGQSQRTLAQHL